MESRHPRIALYLLVSLSVVVSFLPIVWLILTSVKTTGASMHGHRNTSLTRSRWRIIARS